MRYRILRPLLRDRGAARLSTILLLGLLIAFAAGIAWLFQIRFAVGDVYPALSSLRADPLGAKVLYESLAALPGIQVERNLKPLASLSPVTSTILFLNLSAGAVDRRELDALATRGGRLVIAPSPVSYLPSSDSDKKESKDTGKEKKAAPAKHPWGLRYDYCRAKKAPPKEDENNRPKTTVLYFTDLDPAWQVIESGTCGATVIQRAFGTGSIVLAANPFPFSNEALADNPNTELLARLIGANRRIIFDESHFGISQNPGVAMLARQYRLHGVALAILALMLLFVWRNASLFPPVKEPERDTANIIRGQETATGLSRLLRRTVAQPNLIDTCVAEWQKTPAGHRLTPEKIDEVKQRAHGPAAAREPVRVYREITSLLERH